MAEERTSQPYDQSLPYKSVLDGYWEFALTSGRLLDVNDTYCAMSGYQRSELLQMSVADLDRALPSREVVAAYRQLAEHGPSRFRTRHARKSGGSVPVGVTLAMRVGDTSAVGLAFVHNASDRERIDARTRERARLYRTMFEASPICTSVTRLSDSVCIDANDAFLRTFGYERDEVVGEDSSTLDLWVDHSLRDRIMAAVHEDGTVAGFEAFFHTKEDTVRALFLVGALVEIAGEPCALMFGVDITGLKSAQERAAVREAQLRTAIDCAPFGSHTYRLDPDDRLVFVGYNRKAEEILGIDHAALVGQTLEQAFPGNAGTETAVAYRMVAREGTTWESDEYPYDSQGISGVFELHAFATGDMMMTVFFRDVTEKRKLEVAIAESARRLSLSLEGANLGTQDYDVATDSLRLNETACHILGLDPAVFADRPLPETLEVLTSVHPDDRDTLEATVAQAVQAGESYSVRFRVLWPDDSVHWIHSRADAVRDKDGVVVRMIGVTEDVTELEVSRRRLVTSARALNALSYCNQTLARASDEEGLLADVCKVGVEQGGYRTVWVGYPQDDEDKTVKPMAFAGHEEGFLQAADFNWGDTDPERNGPPGLAIRTKEPIVLQDLQEDSRFRAFAKQASLGNYGGSVAAFPLIDSGQHAIGAIMFVRGRRGGFETEELALLDALATDLAYGIEALRTRSLRDRFAADLFATNQRLQEVLRQTVEAMSRIVETRDPYTQGHQVRVDGLARAIAQELGIGESEIDGIETAALVHDIGKLAVPTEILTKPTQLTELEFTLIKEHPQAGYEILKDIDFLWPVAEMVLQHHERMDGSGYPRGLKGPEILRGARIIAVADVVEAMASHRPYRAALGIEAALAEISDLSRFDPEVVAACTILFRSGRFSLEQ